MSQHPTARELLRDIEDLADNGMQVACTSSIPDKCYAEFEAEVARLMPRKRITQTPTAPLILGGRIAQPCTHTETHHRLWPTSLLCLAGVQLF